MSLIGKKPMPGSFLDSNVILYSLSKDDPKRPRALELLASGGLISTQVLGEVSNVMRRKLGYDIDAIRAVVIGHPGPRRTAGWRRAGPSDPRRGLHQQPQERRPARRPAHRPGHPRRPARSTPAPGLPPDLPVRGRGPHLRWPAPAPPPGRDDLDDGTVEGIREKRTQYEEKEWFADRSPEIATARNAADRRQMIAALETEDPPLYGKFVEDLRRADGETQFLRHSGRYPLCGQGDINVYSVFAEHIRGLLGRRGRAGFVVPSGIATDDTTKDYIQAIAGRQELVALYDFQSGPGLFADIGHARFKFALVTLGKNVGVADLVFFARDVSELADPLRRFSLSAAYFRLLNPNTGTCPTFRSRADAELTKLIYRNVPVLIREESRP